ncbi:MAG: HmuY family protein [Treponema sp.]|jgi:hypothetical protein|nr:HmuY family protein [Treponema sp.]
MKHGKVLLGFLVLFCTAALFLGCDTDPGEDTNYGGEQKSLPAVSLATADGTKYYSLSTGAEVTGADIETNKWDIAFSRTRLIYTNSGDSAKGEGEGKGNGGVRHTGKTNLADVSYGEQKDFAVGGVNYNVDVGKYLYTGMGAAPTAHTRFNVMTYVGYGYGDGTTNDIGSYVAGSGDYSGYPATGPFTDYKYDQYQYYTQEHSGGGGPTFASSGQVYIIRHGDGEHYSKIQIAYEFASSKDNWLVTYQNF